MQVQGVWTGVAVRVGWSARLGKAAVWLCSWSPSPPCMQRQAGGAPSVPLSFSAHSAGTSFSARKAAGDFAILILMVL